MARLATLIIDKKGLFFPVPDYGIMVDPTDEEKPGTFLELFPHPLSRLFMVLLWKVNSEQDGDAVVLSNMWLKDFAKLDHKSLMKHRSFLNVHQFVLAVSLGNSRDYLYRVSNPRTGLPLSDETNTDAVARLANPERIKEVARARIMKRYRKRLVEETPAPAKEPVPIRSSWDEW